MKIYDQKEVKRYTSALRGMNCIHQRILHNFLSRFAVLHRARLTVAHLHVAISYEYGNRSPSLELLSQLCLPVLNRFVQVTRAHANALKAYYPFFNWRIPR